MSISNNSTRALINAYGIDERETVLKRKFQHSEEESTANQKIRMTWQDIEEEEYDWEQETRKPIQPAAVPLESMEAVRASVNSIVGVLQNVAGAGDAANNSVNLRLNQPFHHNAPNVSFNHIRGPVPASPSITCGPSPGPPGPTPPLNIAGTLANPQSTGALSEFLSSLVTQGVISLNKQDSIGTEFDPDKLKVRHESTISALYKDLPRQCTTCGLRFKFQEEHNKHMDWHVQKNRNLKNSKTKPSPKWFVNENLWLAGAVGVESGPAFLPVESKIEDNTDDKMVVIANDDQKTCALCGEPFDEFFCDEMEVWMYKGAGYMYAPAGSAAVIDSSQLGPIVHEKCRSSV